MKPRIQRYLEVRRMVRRLQRRRWARTGNPSPPTAATTSPLPDTKRAGISPRPRQLLTGNRCRLL